MHKSNKPKYKGIVVFGAPGSGKTTVAKDLVDVFSGARYIEASGVVIYPAMTLKQRKGLPATEAGFFRAVNSMGGRVLKAGVRREDALHFFTYLKNRYSPAVIAKTLIHIHNVRFSKKFIIIAGIRGYRNSMYFKRQGYLVVYLKAPDHEVARLAHREQFSKQEAEKERAIEERLFSTNMVAKIAHISFSTAVTSKHEIARQVKALVEARECKRCVNSSLNLSSTIGSSGLCDVCERYRANFSRAHLKRERELVRSLRGSGTGRYDAMVGISGGKDSTATLYETQRMGFTPMAFSFDTGYYPKHIAIRARAVAKKLGVHYANIDVRPYMRPVDRASFRKTAELYDEHESEELKEKFRTWYVEGRRHYSIKCAHAIPFVRTCQLCRRIIIRAYYGEAMKRGVRVIILGINEWAGLSQDSTSKKFVFSAVRKLQPFKHKPAVYVVHLPFLLQRRISDTRRILKKLGWTIPRGEELIESNSNSCLFARAAESKARRMLGFHPDMTRLAREVTVGFITKRQATKALAKDHHSKETVRRVLERAGIL